ncbi:MAG TPA: prepilin-type N-terminal cleavage/methylation domain-containing protein [Tenericutes bacterium]|nr:prepilin-type N-terminal cleavage/methylation domain-containing protein [Mycoplasmatota bacterium]
MKRNAFTLIELLAVIIILAVIALISVPLILNIISNVEKKSFINSSYRIVDAGKNSFVVRTLTGSPSKTIYLYNNGDETKLKGNIELNYDGEKPKYGKVIINEEGKVAISLHNGKNCVEKGYEDSKATLTNKSKEQYGIETTLTKYFVSTFGGSSSERFYDVTTTNDGYIAVGYSESSDGDLQGLNKGAFDSIIVKYDLEGNIVWKKTFGGSLDDGYSNITTVTDGYVVVGSAISINGDLAGVNSGQKAIIVKYDLSGNIVWKKL